MSENIIKCPHCAGRGKLPLSVFNPVLNDTLEALRCAGPVCAETLHELVGRPHYCGVTGMSNRLVKLEQMRFAKRRRQGKFWIYEATNFSRREAGTARAPVAHNKSRELVGDA